jgi:hypothetical protein
MDAHRSSNRGSPILAVLAALILARPALAAAQIQAPVSPPVADSAQAVAAACAIVLGLRPRRPRPRCVVTGYEETATEFVVRVREEVAPGEAPPLFDRSDVRFSKKERSVVVTREPEL